MARSVSRKMSRKSSKGMRSSRRVMRKSRKGMKHRACVSRTAKMLHKTASKRSRRTVLKRAQKKCAKQ